MTEDRIRNLIDRLNTISDRSSRIGHFWINEGEADRYAFHIEGNMEIYLAKEFDTEESILEDAKRSFSEMDDDSYMFDEEENEERNAIW